MPPTLCLPVYWLSKLGKPLAGLALLRLVKSGVNQTHPDKPHKTWLVAEFKQVIAENSCLNFTSSARHKGEKSQNHPPLPIPLPLGGEGALSLTKGG